MIQVRKANVDFSHLPTCEVFAVEDGRLQAKCPSSTAKQIKCFYSPSASSIFISNQCNWRPVSSAVSPLCFSPLHPQPGGLESDLPSVKKEMQCDVFSPRSQKSWTGRGVFFFARRDPRCKSRWQPHVSYETILFCGAIRIRVGISRFMERWREENAFISQCVDLSRCPERVAGDRRKTEETDRCCFEPVFCQEIQFLFNSFWGIFFCL